MLPTHLLLLCCAEPSLAEFNIRIVVLDHIVQCTLYVYIPWVIVVKRSHEQIFPRHIRLGVDLQAVLVTHHQIAYVLCLHHCSLLRNQALVRFVLWIKSEYQYIVM